MWKAEAMKKFYNYLILLMKIDGELERGEYKKGLR